MPVEAPDKEIMTTEEAIRYLGVSRPTFYKWWNAGKVLPFNYNDAKERQPNPLYRKSDLDAFLTERRAARLRRQAGTDEK